MGWASSDDPSPPGYQNSICLLFAMDGVEMNDRAKSTIKNLIPIIFSL